MTAKLSLALSLALATAPAFAASHGSHGGGGGGSSSHGGGSSSGGGGGHSSGGGSGYHAVPRGGSSSGGGYARHPGGGTGRYYSHGHYYGHGYYGHGHGYYPYYYGGYYYPYFSFYGGYYPYYDGYYPYSGGGGYSYDYSSPYDGPYYGAGTGAVRLIVEPDNTKVYVDGYYSGVVDDYDGLFQHLDLPMGRHEIILKLEGYQTQHLKVYVTSDETLKVHYTMEKGSGESPKEIVVGDPSMEKYPPRLREEAADHDRPTADREHDEDDDAPPPAHVQMRRPAPRDDASTLRLRVAPDDASIYIDGSFYGTARDVRRLDVAPGPHKIEVVRPGYKTYEKDVDADPDKATNLDVTLER
jgi:hypothetical protein